MHYKVLFLYGSLYLYVMGMLLVSGFALYTDNTLTLYMALFSGSIIAGTIYYFYRTNNYITTSIILLWTSVIFVCVRIVIYKYSLDIAFLLIPPMVSAIILNKKHLVIFSILYVLLVVLVLMHGYDTYPQHPFLHNRRLLITFGIFAFFVVFFGFIYHYSIEQSYTKLEKSHRQKATLLREIHHRVKNNLNMMNSILGLQSYQYSSTEIQDFIEQNILRINSIALVHELLYTEELIDSMDIETYIKKLSQHILSVSNNHETTIMFHIDKVRLNINDSIHLGIIVNELLTNSLKYAFENKGEIGITIKQTSKAYTLQYTDNGCGVAKDCIDKKGFGFSLVSLSAEHLNGDFSILDHQGFKCQIIFQGTGK